MMSEEFITHNSELLTGFELRPAEIPAPITFREGGRKFQVRHILRPPEFDDWLEYENRLNRSVEIVGNTTRLDRDRAEAAEAVWDRTIVRVEGYKLLQSPMHRFPPPQEPADQGEQCEAEGAIDLHEAFPEGWHGKVPLFHKMAAIELLAQVFVAEPEQLEGLYCFDPQQMEVHLVAARGGEERDGLVHVLRRPTARQQKEFSRIVSTAIYVRGSRTGKSLLPSRLRELSRFYDELLMDVRGYALNGAPATRQDALRHMDALHKQTAVSALFAPEET